MFNEKELRAQMIKKNVTVKDVCDRLGIDASTFYRKIKSNGAFTRDEINELIEYLDIDDPMDIFFAPELA